MDKIEQAVRKGKIDAATAKLIVQHKNGVPVDINTLIDSLIKHAELCTE